MYSSTHTHAPPAVCCVCVLCLGDTGLGDRAKDDVRCVYSRCGCVEGEVCA